MDCQAEGQKGCQRCGGKRGDLQSAAGERRGADASRGGSGSGLPPGWLTNATCHWLKCNNQLEPGFFLTPAVKKTKTQGKNSSQKLKEKTQPP